MAKILLVEDDIELQEAISNCLSSGGHKVDTACDGIQAKEMLGHYKFDLVVLDWNIPQGSGVEVLRFFRARGGLTPVIMLTGRAGIDDKEAGLDSGADDYLTKPFEPRELLARVRSLLRRPEIFSGTIHRVGSIVFDPDRMIATKNGEELSLLPLENRLLEFLMRNKGVPFSAETLLARVWDSSSDSGPDAVRTCIKTLRRKIAEPDGSSILKTVYGVGYKVSD